MHERHLVRFPRKSDSRWAKTESAQTAQKVAQCCFATNSSKGKPIFNKEFVPCCRFLTSKTEKLELAAKLRTLH